MIFSALRRHAARNKPKRVSSARELPVSPRRSGTHLRRASEFGKHVYAAAFLRTGHLRSDLRTPPACFAYFAALLQGFRLLMSISWPYHTKANLAHPSFVVRTASVHPSFILHSSSIHPSLPKSDVFRWVEVSQRRCLFFL